MSHFRDQVPALVGELAGLNVEDTLPSPLLARLGRVRPGECVAWEEVTQCLDGGSVPRSLRRNDFESLLVVYKPCSLEDQKNAEGAQLFKEPLVVISHQVASLHTLVEVRLEWVRSEEERECASLFMRWYVAAFYYK